MSRTTYLLLLTSAICLMGARRGCGGDLMTSKELCTTTGGGWDESACPKSCWPPACGASVDQACDTACGAEPVCQCPADKPFWKDGQGCWSAEQCSKGCVGTAKACAAIDEWKSYGHEGTVCVGSAEAEDDPCLVHGCTRDTKTCTSHDGSSYPCYYNGCLGTPTACSTFTDPDLCGGQDGCRWQ